MSVKKLIKNKYLLLILLIASFLRLFKLSQVPVSLFGDELDVGYHAYSILKTGRDYSGNFLPLHFQSLAEWRTPLYLYSVVPTVALFGISALGVRLPAAIFGILGVWAMYLLVREISKKEKLALVSAAFLAISPWHIQYSRAAFEVTELILFLLLGLYFFFRSLGGEKKLWLSIVFLTFTPWIYSTAKLFTPLLMLFLFVVWRKEILSLPKKEKMKAVVAGLIVGLPIAISTIFGGGAQRFGYVSVFTDPTTIPEVGAARQNIARVRGETGPGLVPTIVDRIIYNKFTFWGSKILFNSFQPFSTEFLFNKGDMNLRHSIDGIGQFFKIEIITMLLGVMYFFSKFKEKKLKLLIGFWVLAGVIPAIITRDGGNHATRLIVILPPLTFLIAYGFLEGKKRFGKIFTALYLGLLVLCFISYQITFWVENPWLSERWWHSGWGEGVNAVKEIDEDFDKVIISMAGEPAWIFFAGHYEYSPKDWHENFPVGNDVELENVGKVSHIGKFYFSPLGGDLYEWGKILDEKTLYLANASEVKINLILEPERAPEDLELIKSISYPSGEPAMYLFSGIK